MGLITEDFPRISIIMNCYNGAHYLNDAISSVLGQHYKHWELIFWDNCSDDNSIEIASSFEEPRIRCFSAKAHTSLGHARKLALEKATGDWIGFLDVDDLWFPNKLAEQMASIAQVQGDTGLVYSRCVVIGGSEKLCESYDSRMPVFPSCKILPQSHLSEELFKGNLIPFPSVMYNKQALKEIGGFPNYNHPPDYYMSLAVALKYRAIAVDKLLCAYRIHEKQSELKNPRARIH